MFAIIYVGIQVTMGGTSHQNNLIAEALNTSVCTLQGWSVTYFLEERQGGSESGYISTGFFAGEDVSTASCGLLVE